MSSTSGDKEIKTASKKRLSNYFGMAQPYNFSIALPSLAAFFLLFCVSLMAIGMLATDRLQLGTPRGNFFIYLFLLLVIALVSVRKPKLSWTVITLLFIEFSLAFVPYFAGKVGLKLSDTLLPAATNSRFEYHPILQGVPKPNYSSTLPDGGTLTHTSFGTRGPQPADDLLANGILINAYGGSTTYDVAVSDEQSWPNQLSTLLGSNVAVINRGVPAFTSADNLLQTTFYDQVNGRTPTCSIYYEGWNDARNAHIPTPDAAYADTHVLSLVNELQVRKGNGFTPIMTLLSQMPLIGQDTVPTPTGYVDAKLSGQPDQTLNDRFRKNIQSIIAINSGRNVKTVLVGQILNESVLVGEDAGLIPNVPRGKVIEFIAGLNSIMKDEALKLGATYIDANQSRFTENDFVDEGHFNANGSAKFADQIALEVKAACIGAD